MESTQTQIMNTPTRSVSTEITPQLAAEAFFREAGIHSDWPLYDMTKVARAIRFETRRWDKKPENAEDLATLLSDREHSLELGIATEFMGLCGVEYQKRQPGQKTFEEAIEDGRVHPDEEEGDFPDRYYKPPNPTGDMRGVAASVMKIRAALRLKDKSSAYDLDAALDEALVRLRSVDADRAELAGWKANRDKLWTALRAIGRADTPGARLIDSLLDVLAERATASPAAPLSVIPTAAEVPGLKRAICAVPYPFDREYSYCFPTTIQVEGRVRAQALLCNLIQLMGWSRVVVAYGPDAVSALSSLHRELIDVAIGQTMSTSPAFVDLSIPLICLGRAVVGQPVKVIDDISDHARQFEITTTIKTVDDNKGIAWATGRSRASHLIAAADLLDKPCHKVADQKSARDAVYAIFSAHKEPAPTFTTMNQAALALRALARRQ